MPSPRWVPATFYSLYLVLTRKLSGDEDSLSLLFHANAIGAIALTIAAPATARMPAGWAEWLILPSLGIFGTPRTLVHDQGLQPRRMHRRWRRSLHFRAAAGGHVLGLADLRQPADGFTLLGMLVILAAVSTCSTMVVVPPRAGARADEVASTPE